ncbi:WhiB family transcriptional regulator [Streptomyces sp. R1]|uniref:WhiB family transcriptional regulator n=1 Tax=Streptomyces sp. R1 TaxID=1509279 RepID=UPI001E3EF2C1|nr:WhiB family transcriptional regulator [Streptomyces sp. R1]MCC8339031.1 WhiB family transcriptional regulator [Streptomyces sp. R1]
MPYKGPRAVRQRADGVAVPFPRAEFPPKCSDAPDLFQPVGEDVQRAESEETVRLAKHICGQCPLAARCLKWALANEGLTGTGIWGATTARERRVLRARLALRLGPEWIRRLSSCDVEARPASPSRQVPRARRPARTRAGAG